MIEKTEFGYTGSITDLPKEVRDNPEMAAAAAFACTVGAEAAQGEVVLSESKPCELMPTCEVCGKSKAIGVASVPGVPYSAAYCKECLEANAHPYFILVANTACCGGFDKTCPEWQDMVRDTLAYLGKSAEQFEKDVAESMHDEGVYFSQEAFLEAMRGELKANKRKGEWNDWRPEPQDLILEIEHHVSKLIASLLIQDDSTRWAKVREASADVANYCNKAFDVYGQEPEPKPDEAA